MAKSSKKHEAVERKRKSRVGVARERIEAQVKTLPDGRRVATGVLGLALLYPAKERDDG